MRACLDARVRAPAVLRRAIEVEFESAALAVAAGDLTLGFRHLERAHVLGQAFVVPHVKSHLGMLRIGLRRRDTREIVGQLLRVPGAVIGSLLGHLPVGNTGGANVPAFRPMPIPEDLSAILAER
jgi:hypothetical protein